MHHVKGCARSIRKQEATGKYLPILNNICSVYNMMNEMKNKEGNEEESERV